MGNVELTQLNSVHITFKPEGYINSYPVIYDRQDTGELSWIVYSKSHNTILARFLSQDDMEIMMQSDYKECGEAPTPTCYGDLEVWIKCEYVDNCPHGVDCTAKCMKSIE